MKVFLNQAIEHQVEENQGLETKMHNDLALSYRIKQDNQKRREEISYKETEREKFKRLVHEYSLKHDPKNSEKYIMNL